MKFSCLLLLLFIGIGPASARPSRIILLRHAEKPPGESNIHLSERGEMRAEALAGFLTNVIVLGTNGAPAVLFAPRFTRGGHGIRPYETLSPLAQQLKVRIHTPYRSKSYAALAKHVLNDPAFNGKPVVISWVHDYLPDLAKVLGVRPKPAPWKDSVYDRVWVITYEGNRAVLTDLPQHLLPGDSFQ